MPRSVRSVGLFCLFMVGSLLPPVGQERLAWAQVAPTVKTSDSNPTQATTAKSPTTQTPASGQAAAPPTPAVTASAATTPATTPAAATPATPSDTPAAPSPEAQAAAQAALTAGQAAYASGDYVVAEAQFRTSLGHVPSAAAEYGLAMTLDLEAKPAEACDAFVILFAMADFAALPPDQVRSAQQRFAVLQTIPATVVVTTNTPVAEVEVDGIIQTEKAPLTLRLPSGKHALKATAKDFEPTELELEVKPAEQREVALTLKAVTKPAPAPQPASATEAPPVVEPNPMPAYITLGVAGAAAITGAIFGIQALSAKSTFDKSPTVAHADDVERSALVADMAFGIAFTLGITGVVLLTTDEPADPQSEPKAEAALQLTPYVSRSGGGASAQLTW